MRRFATLALALGVVVGGTVTAAATATGAAACRDDLSGACSSLTATLAVRTGIVTGVMAVVVLFLGAGLLRMVANDERLHAERARERRRELLRRGHAGLPE